MSALPYRLRSHQRAFNRITPYARRRAAIVGATLGAAAVSTIRPPTLGQSFNPFRSAPKRVTAVAKKVGPFRVGMRGIRVKARKRKLRYYDKPPKVNKRFKRNYDKMKQAEKECGKYTYISAFQLRQTSLDSYNVQFQDINNVQLLMGNAGDIRDAASIIFGAKNPNPDPYSTTGNIDDDQKIDLVSGTLDMFLKSTSGHVVNIEIFECTFKKGCPQQSITVSATQSIASMNTKSRGFDVSGVPEVVSYTLTRMGSKIEDLPDLWNYATIKVHTVKLQPGDHTVKRFKIFGRKTMDLQTHQTNNALNNYSAGGKEFFFRTINDPTVSGNASQNKIHRFPSNNKGGVALEYRKTYKLLAPGLTTVEKSICLGNWLHITETTDQQVIYTNPTGSAAIDT